MVGQLGDGRDDLVGQRSELVVYDEGAVVTDRDADVSTAPLEHVDPFGNGDGPDLDVVEILGRAQCGPDQEPEDGGSRASHVHSLRFVRGSHFIAGPRSRGQSVFWRVRGGGASISTSARDAPNR